MYTPSTALNQVIGEISWLWFAFAVMLAFLLGALWYSLLFFKMWNRVFRLESNAMKKASSMVRSFCIQCITGAIYGFLIFVLHGFGLWMAWVGVLTIAGWQMCALTFKYSNGKNFLQATLVESGYSLASGMIYILFASF